jgi:hypothetical protein
MLLLYTLFWLGMLAIGGYAYSQADLNNLVGNLAVQVKSCKQLLILLTLPYFCDLDPFPTSSTKKTTWGTFATLRRASTLLVTPWLTLR